MTGPYDKTAGVSADSAAVQAHLQILQGIIQRMAGNSTSCKTWCITLVSAILVLIADKGNPKLAWLALLPSILFLTLDAYYLALEKAFRSSYTAFVQKLHGGKVDAEDLYSMAPRGGMSQHRLDALKSFSVWGFYGALVVCVWAAKRFLLQ